MAWIFLASLLLFTSLAETAYGGSLLSSLPDTLEIFAANQRPGHETKPNGTWYLDFELIAGQDTLGVLWFLKNRSFPVGTDAAYKTVNLKLCYAPLSQVGKPGRKTDDDLDKDKTCQIEFYTGPYNASSNWQFYQSVLDRHVPAASYFVRAYVNDSAGVLVAYGQSTGPNKDYNILMVSGSHLRHEMVVSGSHLRHEMVSIWTSVFFVLFFLVA